MAKTEISPSEAKDFLREYLHPRLTSSMTSREFEKIRLKLNAGIQEDTDPMPPATLSMDDLQFTCHNHEELTELLEQAEFDPLAYEAAKELAGHLLERDAYIPKPLKDFASRTLREGNAKKPKRPGRNKIDYDLRNRAIAMAVYHLRKQGYKPISRKDTLGSRPSACDLVAEVISEIDEIDAKKPTHDAIEKIYRSHHCSKVSM